MKMLRLFVFLFSSLSFFSAQSQSLWEKKVAPRLLEHARDNTAVPFLVLMADQPDAGFAKQLHTKEAKATYVYHFLREVADVSQQSLKAFLGNRHVAFQSICIVNAIHTKGDIELIKAIAERPDVAMLLDESVVRFAEPVEWKGEIPQKRSAVEWGIERINADDVWAMGYRGQGVVVGGEDTGYDWTHPALKHQYRGYDAVLDTADHNYNWHDAIHQISPLNSDSNNLCGLDVKYPCDDHGHGTHTMGTMIGSDGENEIGVAPDATWCGCRNMERGWGAPYTYLECFEWFLAPTDLNNENPDPSKSPHVINNSWGCPLEEGCDSTNWFLLNIAVNNLRLGGTVVVVSAGNDGSGCGSVADPAAIFEESFSVGATAPNDTIAGFSSRGPVTADHSMRTKPNVSAPGVSVRSARPGGSYGFSSGTSMAGPHVAGLVALIISANPELAGEVEMIEDIIEQTAIPKTTDQQCGDIPGSDVPNNTYGYGRVDALAAVEAALALVGTATQDADQTSSLALFPNPTTGKVNIDVSGLSGKYRIEVFNLSGQVVSAYRDLNPGAPLFSVDLSGIQAGIYFVRVQDDMRQYTARVVKL